MFAMRCAPSKPAASVTYDGRALVTRPLSDALPATRMVLAHRRVSLPPVAVAFIEQCKAFVEAE